MRYERKAFGPQRPMTEADKARNVARSIQTREREGRPWTWQEYGLAQNPQQQARVHRALGKE